MVEHSNAAFLEIYEAIRDLLVRVVRDECMTRYEIGALLGKAKSGGSLYGERAVERLAEMLRIPVSNLYRYQAVATAWSLADYETLLVRTNTRGEPLTWSHLMYLSYVLSTSERRKLVERCLAEDWTSRELARYISLKRAEVQAVEKDAGAADSEAVRIALLEGVQGASRATQQVGTFLEAFESRWVDGAEEGELVERALVAHEKLQRKVADTIDCLRRAVRPEATTDEGPGTSATRSPTPGRSLAGSPAFGSGSPRRAAGRSR